MRLSRVDLFVRPVAALAFAAMVTSGISIASADVVSLSPARDNTLYEYTSGNARSNALGPTLFVGTTSQNLRRRALMEFDLGAIPAGSMVTAVTLSVHVEQGGPSIPTMATLHRVSNAWGQGTSAAPANGGTGVDATTNDPTWLHTFFNAMSWSTPGGDFSPSASGSTTFGTPGQRFEWASQPGMVADVQVWLANPAANHGWIILGEEPTPGSAYRLQSREGANRPTLTITFTPPSTCGSADFDGDGDTGTDADIEAFFACLAGNCCATCGTADFDGDGDTGTDADIEAFFRVLAGGTC